MASVEKQTNIKNEYQNRSAFINDRSKGHGVEKHTRVITLAENGKYISGRKNEDNAIKTGKTSAVTHVKRQAAEKLIDGKKQKAHYGESEPTVSATESNTDNSEDKSANHYVDNSQSSSVQSEKAAELKKELERKNSISNFSHNNGMQKNEVAKYLEREEKLSDVWGAQAENKSKSRKYFSYEKAKIENKYRRRVYKIEKKLNKLTSGKPDINQFTTLRKLAILKQDIVRPLKNGNAIGVATIPATIYLKKLLEKTRLGRLTVRGKEVGSRIISAAENSADTSQSMAIATQKTAEEVIKGTVGAVNRYIDNENAKYKYLREIKRTERAQTKANKYLEKSRDKILAKEEAVISGQASNKQMKKIENFNNKKNANKKQQKIEAKNRKLERKSKKLYNKRLKKNNSAIKNLKKKAKAKLIAIAGSVLGALLPILLIIVVIAIVANFVLYPFFYLTKKKDKVDDFGNEYVENEIEDTPVKDTIQHYYEVMDGVVDDFNAEIEKFLHSGGKFNNTGVINPSEYAQWESDCQDWQAQTEAYQTWDYDTYVMEYGFDPPSISPPEEDYWYSEEELSAMGQKRGPIFEGFQMSKDSDAARVPKGNLYDEMLCTISTFNAKLMTRPETYIVASDTEDPENPETSETEENDNSESESSSNSSGDIIFMTDETVASAYGGADFWDFQYWREDVDCPNGGDCCSTTVATANYDDDGNFIGYSTEEEKYCPSHYVIMWAVYLDFDLDKVWEKYQFDEEDEKNYKDTKKQFDKDKP